MGLLEFSKAVKIRNCGTTPTQLCPESILAESKRYFDLLRDWMAHPEKIGAPKCSANVSKLGDVMCVTGLATEFYQIETDESERGCRSSSAKSTSIFKHHIYKKTLHNPN